MCENALITLMDFLIVRTPHCLKVEHVEIGIHFEFIYELNRDLRF